MKVYSKAKQIINSCSIEKKAAIVFVFTTAITSGLNIITTPLFTRLMPVHDYGVISIYNSWYAVLYVIASFSVANAILNVGFHDYPDDRIGFLSASLGITTVFSIVIGLGLFVTKEWFTSVSGLNGSLMALMIINCIFLTSTQLWANLQKYEYKYKLVFWVLSISAVLSTVLSLFAVMNSDSNYAEVKLWTTYIIQIIIGLWIYVYIVLKGKRFFFAPYWKFILCFNAPLLLHYLSQFILTSSDRIMIKVFANEEAVAIYSLAYSISNISLALFTSINSVIIPYTHKCIDEKNNDALAKCFMSVLSISGIVLVVVSLLAPEFVAILGGMQYYEGRYIVPIVSASTYFIIMYNLTANIEFLFGKTHKITLMTIVAAAINIILNAILIPIFGYIAAAYTTLASYFIYAVLHYRNMKKQLGYSFIKIDNLLSITVLMLLGCFGSIVLFDLLVVRLVTIVGITVLLFFLYKKKIKRRNMYGCTDVGKHKGVN